MLNVEVDASGAYVKLKNIEKFVGSKRLLLAKLANFEKFKILERTAAGKDADERFFKPYSPRYALFRRMHGRPTDKVDLFFHGHMLGSMTVKSGASQAIIYFPDREQNRKATKHHYGKGCLPQRAFFAVSASDLAGMDRIIANETRVLK